MNTLAATEVILSLVTAGLLATAGWRVRRTRDFVSANALFNICMATALVVFIRSGGTVVAEAGVIDATPVTTIVIRFVLLGVAVYIATLANGRKHDG